MDLSVYIMIVGKILSLKSVVFCQKGQNVPKISGTFCPFCQKNL
jgi:hypothetical protein